MFLLKRGNVYYIQYFDKKSGRKKRVSTGETEKAEAEQSLNRFAKRIHFTIAKPLPEEPKEHGYTIEDFEQRYEQHVASMFSKSYLEIVRWSIKMMKRDIQAKYMNEISFNLAERFIVRTYSKAPYAASQYLRTLKAAFTRAMEWGYISQNPFGKVKIPRLPRLLPVFIDQAEFQRILDKTETQDFKDIFMTAFHTGMRRGEILNLRWESIDLAAQTAKVESTQSFSTKWKKERIIPLNRTVIELLTRRNSALTSAPTGFVFPTDRGLPYNGEFVGKKFKMAVRASGVNTKVHFHTLRHSFASNLVQKGVPILIVKELLGHEKLSTTQIYAHVRQKDLADAVSNLD